MSRSVGVHAAHYIPARFHSWYRGRQPLRPQYGLCPRPRHHHHRRRPYLLPPIRRYRCSPSEVSPHIHPVPSTPQEYTPPITAPRVTTRRRAVRARPLKPLAEYAPNPRLFYILISFARFPLIYYIRHRESLANRRRPSCVPAGTYIHI